MWSAATTPASKLFMFRTHIMIHRSIAGLHVHESLAISWLRVRDSWLIDSSWFLDWLFVNVRRGFKFMFDIYCWFLPCCLVVFTISKTIDSKKWEKDVELQKKDPIKAVQCPMPVITLASADLWISAYLLHGVRGCGHHSQHAEQWSHSNCRQFQCKCHAI